MISILGIDPFSENRGIAAMCMATIDLIRKTIPNRELKLLVRLSQPEYSASLYVPKYRDDTKVKIIRMPSNKFHYIFYLVGLLGLSIVHNILKRVNVNINPLLIKNNVLRIYLQSKVIVSLNAGDDFTDIYGIVRSIRWICDYLPPVLLNKNVIFFPQTIGPFSNPITYTVAKYILNKVKIVMVREEISKEYIKKIGIDDQKIYKLPDMAFGLEPVNSDEIKKILEREDIITAKNIIGISLRDLFTPNCVDKTTFEKYLQIMSKLIDHLINRHGVSIILVPHHGIDKTSKIKDVEIATKILKNIKNKDKVYWIHKREYAVEELKGIIGRCDLFIGAYMHANIGALSMCVPTIGLSYSHKFEGIFRMLGQEKWVCNLKNLAYDDLISKIEDAWINREKIRKELEVRMPEIKKQVMFAGELVKKVLDEEVLDEQKSK